MPILAGRPPLPLGLATVLVNLQVVFVTLAAWLIWHERPTVAQALAVPIALAGVVLISGVLDSGACGTDPVLGSILAILTALCYAAYLLLLRKGRDRLGGVVLGTAGGRRSGPPERVPVATAGT